MPVLGWHRSPVQGLAEPLSWCGSAGWGAELPTAPSTPTHSTLGSTQQKCEELDSYQQPCV